MGPRTAAGSSPPQMAAAARGGRPHWPSAASGGGRPGSGADRIGHPPPRGRTV
jgi:hypothetical protein